MIKKYLLPVTILILIYGFWISPEFKETAAGIALFLFGMLCLERGFQAFTGGTLETILRKSTSQSWKSFSFGAVATTLMQSSHLVTLVSISFVSAELITLASGIGIVIGANVGSITGGWLIAGLGLKVDIAAYAMPILIFGVLFLMQKSPSYKGIGNILLGVGFLFLGIHYMKTGFEGMQETFDLTAYSMEGFAGVLVFTLIGFVMTTLVQSSHASLLIIIAAVATGQVSYENAAALIIGAKLGSAITAALGGMASNLAGRRLAMAHLITNAGTVLVGVVIIYQMMWLTDITADLFGVAEDDYLIKLAIFNTVFNMLGVVIFLPFAHQLENLLIKYIKFEKSTADQPIYLLEDALATPSTAVGAVRKEVQRLFENAYGLLAHGISLRRPVIDSNESLSDAVKYTRRIMPLDVDDVYEDKIKSLHSAIVGFIGEAQTLTLTRETTEELYILRQASRDIVEAVKAMKHMHKNLAKYGASNQVAIRENYDAIRLQVAKLLRDLREIIKNPEAVTSLSLDALKRSLEKSGDKLMDNLDELIRTHRIQPAIATSIMNDEAYVRDLGEKLISATQALLVKPQLRSEPAVAFTEQEVDALTSADTK